MLSVLQKLVDIHQTPSFQPCLQNTILRLTLRDSEIGTFLQHSTQPHIHLNGIHTHSNPVGLFCISHRLKKRVIFAFPVGRCIDLATLQQAPIIDCLYIAIIADSVISPAFRKLPRTACRHPRIQKRNATIIGMRDCIYSRACFPTVLP